ISTNEIEDGAVTAAKLAVGAITSSALGAGSVGYENIADGAVSASKVNFNYAGSDSPGGVATSAKTANTANSASTAGTANDVTFNYAGSNSKGGAATSVAANAVGSDQIAEGAVTGAKLGLTFSNVSAVTDSGNSKNVPITGVKVCFLTQVHINGVGECVVYPNNDGSWTLHAGKLSNGSGFASCSAWCF
ncbi:MAG: hypothetical protein JW841_16845, partial [Deltaproteobacteria bacterium]|nr:hypothetical protein [Deltaproteobacteria bacterium]